MVPMACSGDLREPGDLEEATGQLTFTVTLTTSACISVLIFAQVLKTYVLADQLLVSLH